MRHVWRETSGQPIRSIQSVSLGPQKEGQRTCLLQKQHVLQIAIINFNANCSAVANGPLCDTKKLSDTLGQRSCDGLGLFFPLYKMASESLVWKTSFWDSSLKGVLQHASCTHTCVQNMPPVIMAFKFLTCTWMRKGSHY